MSYGFKFEDINTVETPKLIQKYWGSIETLVNKDYCGKRIIMKKGAQSSLEVHCKKHETYFVYSGKVKIGVRVGRAENKSILLKQGDIFHIPPGLMHMRIAVEDCVIIEISTQDDNSDSHIIEDGKTYIHEEVL